MTSRSLCWGDFPIQLGRVTTADFAGVILREKDLPPEDYRALAERTPALCRAGGVPYILHSFPETTEVLGERATRLPLPLPCIPPPERRGTFRVLGTSCHSVENTREAEKLRYTYIIADHMSATDCRKGLTPRGLDFLRAVCHAVDLSVWAIGDITPENFPSVRAAGARRGCVMSGLVICTDPAALLERFARRD